jgi:predicted RNA-binding Zn-ribbon protein involved in translation (DUF1610 family)
MDYLEAYCAICDTFQKVSKSEVKFEGSYFYFLCPYCGEYSVVADNLILPEWKEEIR